MLAGLRERKCLQTHVSGDVVVVVVAVDDDGDDDG